MAKAKKHDVWIDMTAMSDVTVLLLTFFILTATFLPPEPFRVVTPASVMEIKIPEYNVMTVLIDLDGKVFLNIDRPDVRLQVLEQMASEYGVTITDQQKRVFVEQPFIGVPMNRMPAFLDLPMTEHDETMRQYGIPNDSTNNQFTDWIEKARAIDEDMKISLKADASTPYPIIDKVMKDLVHIKANRFSFITVLEGAPEGF